MLKIKGKHLILVEKLDYNMYSHFCVANNCQLQKSDKLDFMVAIANSV